MWSILRKWKNSLCLCLLSGLIALAIPVGAAEQQAGGAALYEQAIKEAENELARTESAAAVHTDGWGVTEVLSLVALLVAIVLVFLATRWSRGLVVGKRGGGEMRILDRMAIGKQNTLLIVRLRGRDYWLAEGADGVRRLEDWPAADEGK